MTGLAMRQVSKSFGTVDIIRGVDLDVAPGELCVFVGPSGCGKSTLLRLVAGLEEATAGRIEIGGRDVTRVDPAERGVAMVFQSYALYPHMTVAENMGFGLRMNGMARSLIEARVAKAARILHLDHLLERRPKQLSGGQRQRVAIGRAIVREPQIFLFDEPLSNLDAELRVQMRLEIAKLHADLGATIIYVTHDQVEAMTLADKIVVLNAGRIEQAGAPLELYDNPANVFVAGFIGSPRMNFLAATGTGEAAVTLDHFGMTRVPAPVPVAAGRKATLGIRPEHFMADGPVRLPVRVDMVENLGGTSYAYVRPEAEGALTIDLGGARGVQPGAEIAAAFDPARCFLFDPGSGLRLG
jgi:lactose/L-arabinose transport system ATP-binding protein